MRRDLQGRGAQPSWWWCVHHHHRIWRQGAGPHPGWTIRPEQLGRLPPFAIKVGKQGARESRAARLDARQRSERHARKNRLGAPAPMPSVQPARCPSLPVEGHQLKLPSICPTAYS